MTNRSHTDTHLRVAPDLTTDVFGCATDMNEGQKRSRHEMTLKVFEALLSAWCQFRLLCNT